MFDKFFDCLNVNSFTKGKHSRKPFQNPYRSAKDFRLKGKLLIVYHVSTLHILSTFVFLCSQIICGAGPLSLFPFLVSKFSSVRNYARIHWKRFPVAGGKAGERMTTQMWISLFKYPGTENNQWHMP